MKKIISLLLALTLLLGILAVPAMADSMKVGTLSYLNLTEENGKIFTAARRPLIELLVRYGVMEGEKLLDDAPAFRLYDSLNAMLMALQSGEVDAIKVPYYTGKYLCSTNDGLKPRSEYHPEKATGAAAKLALGLISDGYSFMLKEENTELRDAFSAQIAAMKEVDSLFLMSGGYDLFVKVYGKTFQDIAMMVAKKLSTIPGVTGTKTHFMLKKYKEDGIAFTEEKVDLRGIL